MGVADAGEILWLARVGRLLADRGVTAYLVGGWVRDRLIGRPTRDIDLAVAGDGLEVARLVADGLGASFVPLDEVNRIGRVVAVGWTLDFAALQGDIGEDLGRRDFTINAIAVELSGWLEDPAHLALIDPRHGADDLRDKLVRAVSEGALAADPIRLLRGVRLAAQLGFAIEHGTEDLIRRDAALIARVAGERVREEVLLLLAVPGPGRWLARLDRLRLLEALFPEMAAARGAPQPVLHQWDVFEHSLQTVQALDFLLREADWEHAPPGTLGPVPWSAEIAAHFDGEVGHGSTHRTLAKLAALLHDVAKPQTMTVEPDGRVHFLGHGETGAGISGAILARLRFSAREVRLVETMVRHHLRPTQMGQPDSEMPSRRAVYRYLRDTGEAAIDILYLSLADHLATRGPTLDLSAWQVHTGVVAHVLAQREPPGSTPPKLIDGHDIMDTFGEPPGPRLGELLELVREAQAAGEVASREEALALVKKALAGPSAGQPKLSEEEETGR